MKNLKKQAKTRKITAFLFFALTLYTAFRVIILKFPTMPVVHNSSAAYLAGFHVGWIIKMYASPVIFVLVGWLFYKSGKKKLQESHVTNPVTK